MKPEDLKTSEERWDHLSRNGILCSQPKLALTPEEAKNYLNRTEYYGDGLRGKSVLCLASGGGQQSIAFALLGAKVTVVDFSAQQLEKDRLVAEKYNVKIKVVKSNMSDLSRFSGEEFDVVYQPYSLNYIPEIDKLFDEVHRVLKRKGLYDLMFHNPYVHGSWRNGCWEGEWKTKELWQGKGYPIWQFYRDGAPVEIFNPRWEFTNPDDVKINAASPQEYRHTMSTLINGLIIRRMEIVRYEEEAGTDFDSDPGTWEHYKSCLPPWIYLLSRKK